MSTTREPRSGAAPSQDGAGLGAQPLAAALQRHRAQFATVKRCASLTIDVTEAALRVLEVSDGWGAYAARIAALPATEVDHAQLANIESFALATLQADAEYLTLTLPADDLFDCLKEAAELRETLCSGAAILVRCRLLPAKVLDRIDRGWGYVHVALGLNAIAVLLTEHWSGLQGKTAITLQELQAASLLAEKMLVSSARRRDKHPLQRAAATLRAQAFTTLVNAYEEMRRCLEYLEPQRFDELAPSLYRQRARPAARKQCSAPRSTAVVPTAADPTRPDAITQGPIAQDPARAAGKHSAF